MVSGYNRELNAHVYSAASVKYHAPDPVTLSWHWIDQSPVSLSAKRGAPSTIFNNFGVPRPRMEPVTSRSLERTLYQLSYRGRYIAAEPNLILLQVIS